PCAGEKESTSCRLPLRGLSSPPHRRTGAPGRAARHPGAHSVRHRCAVAKEPIVRASALSATSRCANVSVSQKPPFVRSPPNQVRRAQHSASLNPLVTLLLTWIK